MAQPIEKNNSFERPTNLNAPWDELSRYIDTHTDTQTDGTIFITSTADAGGKMHFCDSLLR